MKAVVLCVAALCVFAFAAGDAVLVPQSDKVVAPATSVFDAVTIPRLLSYQGKLTDSLGVPVPDTTYSVVFRLYTQPAGGSPFWNETQTVRTNAGLFSVLLGSVTPVGTIPDAGAVYLGMAVGGGSELTPRLRIVSAAYSYLTERAANSDLLQTRDTTYFARAAHTHAYVDSAGGAQRVGGLNVAGLDARYVNEGQASSVTSAMITDGNVATDDIRDTTIVAADIKDAAITATKLNQMGAGTGQVLKWTGSAWAPRNDSIGGGGDNAWVRGTPDSVLYTIRQLGIARGASSNMLHGTNRFTHTNLGVSCTTGTSGQNYNYCTVGGGSSNNASGSYATVAGGERNSASGTISTVGGGGYNTAIAMATVGGGWSNFASGQYSTVAGGCYDTVFAYAGGIASGYRNVVGDAHGDTAAVVVGGRSNRATAKYAAIGGGYGNSAGGASAVVSGGTGNSADGDRSSITGGSDNSAGGRLAHISGGSENVASGTWSTVGGGIANEAVDSAATVAGGQRNYAGEVFSTVGGGDQNTASSHATTVAGGFGNTASGAYATVAGGWYNTASGDRATVAGGGSSIASDQSAFVGGGDYNTASGAYATVGGGFSNTASGAYATVPGGLGNRVRGNVSFAAGRHTRANHRGSFVWSDSAVSIAESVYTTGNDQFRVRARGGTWFFSNAGMSTGAVLASGSNSWGSASDSMNKTDFAPVDRGELLRRVAGLRVRYYRMKDQHDGTRHIGPVAQDFRNAFGVGESDKAINMADADGVLFAAVQALYAENQELRQELEALKAQLLSGR